MKNNDKNTMGAGAEFAPLTNEEILLILGNGNLVDGFSLLQKFTYGLAVARKKHSWGKGKEIDNWHKALNALIDENEEWVQAMQHEPANRQLSEALDVMIVATRIANREWE